VATTFKPLYGSSTAITLGLQTTPLASGNYWQSAFVDNSANLFADVLINAKTSLGSAATANNTMTVFGYWSLDGGTTYSNNASGTDSAYTLPEAQANLRILATEITAATAGPYYFAGFSFCQAAGLLFLPQRWGLIFFNGSGQTMSSTAGNHVFSYQGVNWQGI
jgi:hypothetical protein